MTAAASSDSLESTSALCLRLSSLGDVVLASTVVTIFAERGKTADWVTLDSYRGLLEGHPGVCRVISFRRADGFWAWVRLVWRLARCGAYREVYDLHGSLRTRLARGIFFFFASGPVRWRTFPKERWRNWGFYLFKAAWPRSWRPRAQRLRYSELVDGKANGAPNLEHLLLGEKKERRGVCVMPSARGRGKTWGVSRWIEALSRLPDGMKSISVLGTASDRESRELLMALRDQLGNRFEIRDLTCGLSYTELARELAGAEWVLSVDTGLAHLAEALGTRVVMLFGPTSPHQGFGPWRSESRFVESSLWCRPCGRDGRFCFRLTDRFACQRELQSEALVEKVSLR